MAKFESSCTAGETHITSLKTSGVKRGMYLGVRGSTLLFVGRYSLTAARARISAGTATHYICSLLNLLNVA